MVRSEIHRKYIIEYSSESQDYKNYSHMIIIDIQIILKDIKKIKEVVEG